MVRRIDHADWIPECHTSHKPQWPGWIRVDTDAETFSLILVGLIGIDPTVLFDPEVQLVPRCGQKSSRIDDQIDGLRIKFQISLDPGADSKLP